MRLQDRRGQQQQELGPFFKKRKSISHFSLCLTPCPGASVSLTSPEAATPARRLHMSYLFLYVQ